MSVRLAGGEGLVKRGARSTQYLDLTWAMQLPQALRPQPAPFLLDLSRFINFGPEKRVAKLSTEPEIRLMLPTTLLTARLGQSAPNLSHISLRSSPVTVAPILERWICFGHFGDHAAEATRSEVFGPDLILDLVTLSYALPGWEPLRFRVIEILHPVIIAFSGTGPAMVSSMGEWAREDFGPVSSSLTNLAASFHDTPFLECIQSLDYEAAYRYSSRTSPVADVGSSLLRSFESQMCPLVKPFVLTISLGTRGTLETGWSVDPALMAARCPFFVSLLSSGLQESVSQQYQIQLDDSLTEAEAVWAVKALLRYLYSATLPQDSPPSNDPNRAVEAMLELAQYWGLLVDHMESDDQQQPGTSSSAANTGPEHSHLAQFFIERFSHDDL